MGLLTDAQVIVFRDEIENDPASKGYQALLQAGWSGHVIDRLNEQTELVRKETWITDLGLMARLGVDMARSIIGKLKALAGSDDVIAAVVDRLKGGGLDIADPETIAMIDQLTPGAFTADEGNALKGLSMQPASRMEVRGLPYAQEQMLGEI